MVRIQHVIIVRNSRTQGDHWQRMRLGMRLVAAACFGICCLAALASEGAGDPVHPCNTNVQTAIGVGDLTATLVDRYGQLRRPEWDVTISVGDPRKPVTNWRPSQTLAQGYLPVVRTVFPPETGELSTRCFSSDSGGGAADYIQLKTGKEPVHLLLTPTAGPPQVRGNTIVVSDRVLAVFSPPRKTALVKPERGLVSEGTTGEAGWGRPAIPCDRSFRNIRVGWEGGTIRYVFPADTEKTSYVYLGFIESYWGEPGQRILNVRVNADEKSLDPIKDASQHEPVMLSFAVEDASEVKIEVVAAENSADKNSTLAAIWIFDQKVDPRELLLGRLSRRAEVYVDCGSPTEEVMRPGMLISFEKGSEAWVRLPLPGQPIGDARVDADVGKNALSAAETRWKRFLSSGATVLLPDEKLNDLYRTSVINLMLLRLRLPQESPEEDIYVARPGVAEYADFWYRDGAYICRALDVAGYPEEAERSLRLFWRSKRLLNGNNAWLQLPNGCWNYPLHQWDGQGQAPWALMSHYRLTRDTAWLRKVYPSLLAGGHWTKNAIAKTKWSAERPRPITWGLFPEGRGDAIGEGYIYYHNFWGVFGMREIAEAAKLLGEKEDWSWMRETHKQFEKDLLRSVTTAFETAGQNAFIPGDPFSSRLRIWGGLAAVYPCGILDPNDAMVTGTLKTMWERMETASPGEDEYVFVTHPKLWTYMTAEWAQCYLLRGELEKFRRLFEGYVRHASPTNAWIEEVFLDTRLGTGDMPHGWAAAGYILLVRNSIALERGGALHIGAGILPEWLMKGTIEVENLPTEFGRINLTIRRRGKGQPLSVALQIVKFPDGREKVPVVIHVPRTGDWDNQEVLVNGEALPVRRGVVETVL